MLERFANGKASSSFVPTVSDEEKKRFKTYAGHWRQDNKLECLSLANIFQLSQSDLYTAAKKRFILTTTALNVIQKS